MGRWRWLQSQGERPRSAAVLAAVGFLLVACFQVALALGAPRGKAAWGGAHERLPNRLRIASSFAVILWLLAALVVLTRAGYDWAPLPFSVARWGNLGAVRHAAARHTHEPRVLEAGWNG
jgi:hypothetical protein